MLSILGLACACPAERPPPQEPMTSAEPSGPDPTLTDEPDPLDGLGGGDSPAAAPRPDPIEVTIDAVITEQKDGAQPLMVGVDPRFTFYMKVEQVEPETPLLEPGHYTVVIHSPSRTFRSPIPDKGTHIRFGLTIFPDDPNDPNDEPFFASLWVD
jgi:hypothetical protein